MRYEGYGSALKLLELLADQNDPRPKVVLKLPEEPPAGAGGASGSDPLAMQAGGLQLQPLRGRGDARASSSSVLMFEGSQ